MFDDSGDCHYTPYEPTLLLSMSTTNQSFTKNSNYPVAMSSSTKTETVSILPTNVADIILNLKMKLDYPELREFVRELTHVNDKLSILQSYTLHLLNDPIDMSNQSEKKIYRPKLFLRKNDEFGPFNHYHLLNLLDIEYECPNQGEFPDVWKTTDDTKVTVKVFQRVSQHTNLSLSNATANATEKDTTTLIDMLRVICRENNYDETDATKWFDCLKSKFFCLKS